MIWPGGRPDTVHQQGAQIKIASLVAARPDHAKRAGALALEVAGLLMGLVAQAGNRRQNARTGFDAHWRAFVQDIGDGCRGNVGHTGHVFDRGHMINPYLNV
jgi:hypothetical protein